VAGMKKQMTMQNRQKANAKKSTDARNLLRLFYFFGRIHVLWVSEYLE